MGAAPSHVTPPAVLTGSGTGLRTGVRRRERQAGCVGTSGSGLQARHLLMPVLGPRPLKPPALRAAPWLGEGGGGRAEELQSGPQAGRTFLGVRPSPLTRSLWLLARDQPALVWGIPGPAPPTHIPRACPPPAPPHTPRAWGSTVREPRPVPLSLGGSPPAPLGFRVPPLLRFGLEQLPFDTGGNLVVLLFPSATMCFL